MADLFLHKDKIGCAKKELANALNPLLGSDFFQNSLQKRFDTGRRDVIGFSVYRHSDACVVAFFHAERGIEVDLIVQRFFFNDLLYGLYHIVGASDVAGTSDADVNLQHGHHLRERIPRAAVRELCLSGCRSTKTS